MANTLRVENVLDQNHINGAGMKEVNVDEDVNTPKVDIYFTVKNENVEVVIGENQIEV